MLTSVSKGSFFQVNPPLVLGGGLKKKPTFTNHHPKLPPQKKETTQKKAPNKRSTPLEINILNVKITQLKRKIIFHPPPFLGSMLIFHGEAHLYNPSYFWITSRVTLGFSSVEVPLPLTSSAASTRRFSMGSNGGGICLAISWRTRVTPGK